MGYACGGILPPRPEGPELPLVSLEGCPILWPEDVKRARLGGDWLARLNAAAVDPDRDGQAPAVGHGGS